MIMSAICSDCGNTFDIDIEDFGGAQCEICESYEIDDEMEEMRAQGLI